MESPFAAQSPLLDKEAEILKEGTFDSNYQKPTKLGDSLEKFSKLSMKLKHLFSGLESPADIS